MATVTINRLEQEVVVPQTDTFTLSVENAIGDTGFSMELRDVLQTDTVTINWGDGNIENFQPIVGYRHNYASNFTGVITITVPDNIGKVFSINNNVVRSNDNTLPRVSMPFSFNTSEISGLVNINELLITESNTCVGDINNIPNSAVEIRYRGQSNISGDMSTVSLPNINVLELQGNTSVFGSISSTITNAERITITGENEVSGNIESFTKARFIDIRGNNILSGNAHNLYEPIVNITIFSSSNTVALDVESIPTISSNLNSIQLQGEGFYTGNLDNSLNLPNFILDLNSPNLQISGNINNFNNELVLKFENGSSTITGNLEHFISPNFTILNSNTTTVGGDLSLIQLDPDKSTRIEIRDLLGELTYSQQKDWSLNGLNRNNFYFINNVNSSFTPQMMDQLIIDLDNSTFNKSLTNISALFSGGFSRTSNSDTAFNNLANDGYEIVIN